ncbi:MAG: protease modulator HflC [Deltaproteobacteria bacterium]|nr:MAG: protease modulator HflC [Deltaproteobacteria bacterium]
MSIRKILLIAVIAVGFGAVNLIFFQVDLTEYVVVTQFGKPVRAVTDPGLNWKLPDPIQSIQRFDNRLTVFLPNKAEFLTKDKKNIVVESYPAWKITNPIEFLKTVKDVSGAQARLSDIVSSELGVAFGKYDLTSLVTTNKKNMKLKEMMDGITRNSNEKVKDYGILIVDVRLKVLSFPEKNKLSVFQRMRAEREKIARKYRSEGSEEASKIRAEADKEKTIILSKAYEKAQMLKGEGDAGAIRIYADAFQKDPEFYKFLRSLQAYEKFIDKNTTAILPTDSELLKYFASPKK